MKGCSGQCLAGVIIAIIFGGLFLWTLVDAVGLQWRVGTYWALAEYLLALVFLAVAKAAKMWAMCCTCKGSCICGSASCAECTPETPKKARRKR